MSSPTNALLLIAPSCPHCKSVLEGLSLLIKEGKIGRLEVINMAVHPEIAHTFGARSTPWTRIGQFELTGNYTPSELAEWAGKAADGTGDAEYLQELLEQQQFDTALAKTREKPVFGRALIQLAADKDTPMAVRIGVSAMIEELAPEGLLNLYLEDLGTLTGSEAPNIRADAAHYLGLTGNPEAKPYIEALLNDPVEDVREIAAESLESLEFWE